MKIGSYSQGHEFFRDDTGLIYRGRPEVSYLYYSLVHYVMKVNHDAVYAAHAGFKRTCDLIALSFWWPGMRKSVQEYVQNSDSCQRRKNDREFTTPLGEVEEPTASFCVTSLDVTGPYLRTPRRNRYLLTFIDHFSKFV